MSTKLCMCALNLVSFQGPVFSQKFLWIQRWYIFYSLLKCEPIVCEHSNFKKGRLHSQNPTVSSLYCETALHSSLYYKSKCICAYDMYVFCIKKQTNKKNSFYSLQKTIRLCSILTVNRVTSDPNRNIDPIAWHICKKQFYHPCIFLDFSKGNIMMPT